jgi:hypothetical protein
MAHLLYTVSARTKNSKAASFVLAACRIFMVSHCLYYNTIDKSQGTVDTWDYGIKLYQQVQITSKNQTYMLDYQDSVACGGPR